MTQYFVLTCLSRLEVIVVDDGSTLEEANVLLQDLRAKFAPKGWQVMQQVNRGPGAARNQAAQLAKGEFLFFMDDDNYAKRDEITTFVNVAAYTGADVLTCVNDYFFGNDPPPYGLTPTGRWVPIGDAKTVGMFQNMYGDTNAMIRKSAFEEVGGVPGRLWVRLGGLGAFLQVSSLWVSAGDHSPSSLLVPASCHVPQ